MVGQVRSGLHTHDDLLQLAPEVLNGVEVTTLTNPVQHRDVLIVEPGGDGAGRVTRRAVLHEDLRASHPHAGLQVLLQDHLVHGGVHLGILLDEEEPPKFGVSEGRPNHQFGRVLQGADDEVWMVSGNGG